MVVPVNNKNIVQTIDEIMRDLSISWEIDKKTEDSSVKNLRVPQNYSNNIQKAIIFLQRMGGMIMDVDDLKKWICNVIRIWHDMKTNHFRIDLFEYLTPHEYETAYGGFVTELGI